MKHAAIAIALAAALVACQTKEERVAEHIARASEYLNQGKPNEALLELRSALKADATNPRTCERIGRVYEAVGNLQQAYFFYLESSRLDPENVGMKLQVARLLLGDDPDEAARLTEEALERVPDNPMAWARLSEIRLVQADADAALAAALTAVELGPENPTVMHQLGRVHEARYRRSRLLSELDEQQEEDRTLLEDALGAFDRAAALFAEGRGGATNQLERARVLRLLGRIDEAEDALRTALQLATDRLQKSKVIDQALEYGRRNSPEVRRWALEQRIELLPGSVLAWAELAELEPGEQPEAGRPVLERMVEQNPGLAGARRTYARFLARYDAIEEAIAMLAAAEADPAIEPKPPLALDRATLLIQQQDLEAARAVAERMQADHPDAPQTALVRAQLELHDGRIEESIEILSSALERAGVQLSARRLLAQAHRLAGDPDRALSEINEVIALSPRDAEMLALRGELQVEKGLWREAQQTFRDLDRVRPLSRSEQVWLARALYGAGRTIRARALLQAVLARGVTVGAALAFAENEITTKPRRSRQLLEAVSDRGAPGQRAKVLELLVALDLRDERFAEALQRVNAVFEAGAATPDTLLLRAKVLLAMGQLEAGERDLLALVGRGSADFEVADLIVKVYAAQGRTAEAIRSFEEASAAGVLPPETRLVLARLYWAENDLENAVAMLDLALGEGFDSPEAKNDLAFLLADRGQDMERALQLAQEARAALPDDPNTADTLGWVYLRRGLSGPAIEQFREAISSAPPESSAIYHHHLGLALREAGLLDDARTAFETALATDPEFDKKDEARAALAAMQQAG